MANLQRQFIKATIYILAVTCFFKTISVFQSVKALDTPDFFFYFFTIRMVMAISAFVEFLTILCLSTSRISQFAKLTIISWLSSAFITYRASAILTGAAEPCPCLGNIYGWSSGVISPHFIKWSLWLIVAYLFVGSYLCIFLYKSNQDKILEAT